MHRTFLPRSLCATIIRRFVRDLCKLVRNPGELVRNPGKLVRDPGNLVRDLCVMKCMLYILNPYQKKNPPGIQGIKSMIMTSADAGPKNNTGRKIWAGFLHRIT